MTAAAPDGGVDGRDRPVQLGALLVQRGVLTEEQLSIALSEQQETGRPLGEVLVRRGFAPGPIVAQALATQRGGMVKTEYGYATGWTDGAPQAAAPAAPARPDPRDETIRQLREWATSAQAAIASRDTEIERLRGLAASAADAAELEAAREQIAQLEAKLAQPVAEDPRVGELTAKIAELQGKLVAASAEDPRVQELTAEVAELRAKLAEPPAPG